MKRDENMDNKETLKCVVLNSEGYIEVNRNRAYELSDGDVFTVKCKDREYTLEYENKFLYEVVLKVDDQNNDKNKQYSYYNNQWIQSNWERTGLVLTPTELNALF